MGRSAQGSDGRLVGRFVDRSFQPSRKIPLNLKDLKINTSLPLVNNGRPTSNCHERPQDFPKRGNRIYEPVVFHIRVQDGLFVPRQSGRLLSTVP